MISSSCSYIHLMGQTANICPSENVLSRKTSTGNKSIKFESSDKTNPTYQPQMNTPPMNNPLPINTSKPMYLSSKLSNMANHINQSHLFPLIQVVSDPPTASSGMVTISPFSYSPIAQRGRTFAARHTKRLVFKDGSCNVTSANVTQKKKKYLVDIFTTCVDMRWRYLLALFAGAFIFSWIIFGIAWYAIALSYGDHMLHATSGDNVALQDGSVSLKDFGIHSNSSEIINASNVNSSPQISSAYLGERKPCVNNVYDFPTALLFSIETQHTIGYGFRVVEPTCSSGIFLIMVQSCIGIFVQSLMTGLIFAKLSQPKKRAHTIMFSRCAVITKRDGIYCLLFRVGDMRRSHFVATSIRALLVKDRVTKEGECIPLCQYPLDVKTETSAGDAFVFMVWPVVVVHKIDGSSPLWNLSASQLI